MNLLKLGKMKEILSRININYIPFGENTEDVAFAILLECSKDSNKDVLSDLCELLGVENGSFEDESCTELIITKLNDFFLGMGEKFKSFLAIMSVESKQQSEMVGNVMANALLEKLKDSMSSTTDLESWAKTVSEKLLEVSDSQKPVL